MFKLWICAGAVALLLTGCSESNQDSASGPRDEAGFVQELRAKQPQVLERVNDQQLISAGDATCKASANGAGRATAGLNDVLGKAGFDTQLTQQVGPDLQTAASEHLCNR